MRTRKERLASQLASFDVSSVDPKIAARAKQIMEHVPTLDAMKAKCASSASVHQWVSDWLIVS